MAGNKIRVSSASPIRFFRVDPPAMPQYNYVWFDQDWFANTIKPWQTPVQYFQKWQQTDTIYLQVRSNYDPLVLKLMDCSGRVVSEQNFELQNTAVQSDFLIYETNIQVATLIEGVYYLLLVGGFGANTQTMVSEGIDVRAKHPDTILIEYSNSFNKGEIIWDTGIKMAYRIPGDITNYEPGSDDVLYIDQPRNTKLLSSTPFDAYTFSIGGSFGIPDADASLVNQIFSFNSVLLDGRAVVKAQGSKLEKNEIENYPLRGWTLPIQPAKNVGFTEFDDTFDDQITMIYNIQTTLFGQLPPSDGTISISENI